MPSLTEAIEKKYHSSEDSETEAIEGVSFRIFAPKVGPAGCVPSILVSLLEPVNRRTVL